MSSININTFIDLLTAILLAYVAWRSNRNTVAINQVHLAVNSRLDQLIEEVRENVLAKGIAEGRNQVNEEHKRQLTNDRS